MIAIAAVIGRKLGIRPKRYDDWLVVPNLLDMPIGPPSVMKTAAIQEGLKPLKQLEIEAKKRFQEQLNEYEVRCWVAQQRRELANKQVKATDTVEGRRPLVDNARRGSG